MYSKTVPQKQLIPWLAAALIPTTLQLGAGDGWVVALISAGACGLLASWVWHKGATARNPILATAQAIVIVLMLSQLLGVSSKAWPGDNYPAVPLILLALCVWTCWKGTRVAARVGCILYLVVMILYPLVTIIGAEQIKMSWLSPRVVDIPWRVYLLLLLPAAAIILRESKGQRTLGLHVTGIIYVVGTVIVTGVLSFHEAQSINDPFYKMVQSINILGIAPGFDAVLSAGMTVGWYALTCLLLSLAAAWAEHISPRMGKIGLLMAAIVSAGAMLCNLHISSWILAVLATVFWVIIPILTQGLVEEKKS